MGPSGGIRPIAEYIRSSLECTLRWGRFRSAIRRRRKTALRNVPITSDPYMNWRTQFAPPIPSWDSRRWVATAFIHVEAERGEAEVASSKSACIGAQFPANSLNRCSCDSQQGEISLSGVDCRKSVAVLTPGSSGASSEIWNGSFIARPTLSVGEIAPGILYWTCFLFSPAQIVARKVEKGYLRTSLYEVGLPGPVIRSSMKGKIRCASVSTFSSIIIGNPPMS